MTDTSGRMSYAPFAKWDHDSRSWKTSEDTCLLALTLSSLTLPQSGGLRSGQLFERPTPVHATSAPDSSSLPTPTVDDASNITRASGCYNSLTRAATTMLPTPSAADGMGGHLTRSGDRSDELLLPGLVKTFLPTPAVNDMGEGKTLEWWDDWAPQQKSSDGRPAPHGRSLAIEAQRMLPTPRAQEPRTTTVGYGKSLMEAVTGEAQNGETTAPPSPDGSASPDDPHQHQLSLDAPDLHD